MDFWQQFGTACSRKLEVTWNVTQNVLHIFLSLADAHSNHSRTPHLNRTFCKTLEKSKPDDWTPLIFQLSTMGVFRAPEHWFFRLVLLLSFSPRPKTFSQFPATLSFVPQRFFTNENVRVAQCISCDFINSNLVKGYFQSMTRVGCFSKKDSFFARITRLRDLNTLVSDMNYFIYGCDILEVSAYLTQDLKAKGVSMNGVMTCSSPIESI